MCIRDSHHVVPYAVGGEATIANIQLRCRAHNGYEADLFFATDRRNRGAAGLGERLENDAVSWAYPPVPERTQPQDGAARSRKEPG